MPAEANHETLPPDRIRTEGSGYTPPMPERIDDYAPGMPVRWHRFPAFMRLYAHNPIAVFSEEHFEQKKWDLTFAGNRYVSLHDPAVIRELLVRKADIFKFDPIRKRVLGRLSGDSLLVTEGEPWKRVRHTVSPIFTPKMVAPLAQTMRHSCERWAADLSTKAEQSPGGLTLNLADAAGGLAYEILADSLFSSDIQGDPERLRTDLEKVLHTMGSISPLDMLGVPSWVPRVGAYKVDGARRRFRAQIAQNITHRRNRTDDAPASPRPDLLDLMLNARSEDGHTLSDQEIEDNLVAFVGAGYETTARALGWAIYILSQDTYWRERVEAETEAADLDGTDPAKWGDILPVTKAVFEETMRLYPPVSLIVRRAQEDVELGDEFLKRGTTVVIWSFVLHRHKSLWSDPDVFRPERFLPENRDQIDRFAYLPFGAGQRICVGMTFALQEAVIALATMMRRLRFTYVGERSPQPQMRITLRPDNGIPMRVGPR